MAGVIPSNKIVELAAAGTLGVDQAKQAMIKAVGDISKIEIFGNNLFVATYMGKDKTDGGVHLPESTIRENEFQGNVGLVLKSNFIEGAEDDPLHQWVMFGYNDGLRFRYNNVPCRIISIDRVRAIVPDPTKVL